MFRAEPDAFSLRADCDDDGRTGKNDKRGQRHGIGIAGSACKDCLQVSHTACEQYSALIRKPRQKPTNMIRRQFRNVSRDDTPCAMYCELQQERSRSQQSGCGRERPQWDDQHRQCESEPNRPAPADVVRDKSGENAADERSKRTKRKPRFSNFEH